MLNTDKEKMKDSKKNNDCFIAEPDTPYPLCVGREWEQCKKCQLYTDWDEDDYE